MVFPQLILLLLIKTGSNLPPYTIDPPESQDQLTHLGNNGSMETGFICYLLSFDPNAAWKKKHHANRSWPGLIPFFHGFQASESTSPAFFLSLV